mgnify:CR=1 FL=1
MIDEVIDEKEQSNELIDTSNSNESNRNLLTQDSNQIVESTIKSNNIEEIKNLTQLFNINSIKKNMLRVNELNELMDLANREALDRFKKYAPFMEDKDIANYMKIFQQSLINSQNIINSVDEKPIAQINIQNNVITHENDITLSKESRDKILNVVQALMKTESNTEESVVDSNDYEIDEETT